MCSLSVPRDRVVMEVSMCVRAQEFRKLRGIFGEILLLLCDVGGDPQEQRVKLEGSRVCACGWRHPAWSRLPGCEVVSSLLSEIPQVSQSLPGMLLGRFNT